MNNEEWHEFVIDELIKRGFTFEYINQYEIYGGYLTEMLYDVNDQIINHRDGDFYVKQIKKFN